MYIDENYSNYKYLVESHDNYVVLSTSSAIHGESGDTDTVNAIIQYINPPYTIPITYSSEKTFTFTNVENSLSSSIYERADFFRLVQLFFYFHLGIYFYMQSII